MIHQRKPTFRKSNVDKSERAASMREEETADPAKEDEKAIVVELLR